MNRNRNIKIIIFILFAVISLLWFFIVWTAVNYKKHVEIKMNLVQHPEFIPSYKTARITSAGFENIISDFYWLSSIQYIWSNAVSSEYKLYLYNMLNLITDLNPNFSYPYEIWELLLSSYNENYEQDIEKDKQKEYDKQALNLWLKWIKNLCNSQKVEAIKKETNLSKLWTDKKYENPCTDSNVPYYLAYIYYWNFHDWIKSSEYYRITSANKEAPSGSRIMAAIMQWKWWDREKSVSMFLSLAESLWNNATKECKIFSADLRNQISWIFWKKILINEDNLKQIEYYRKQIIKTWTWIKEESLADESDCTRYLNKAVRELNLQFLEKADEKFFKDKWKHAVQWLELLEKWYIKYLPVDYQWRKDFDIIYYYNKDTNHWDNKVSDF